MVKHGTSTMTSADGLSTPPDNRSAKSRPNSVLLRLPFARRHRDSTVAQRRAGAHFGCNVNGLGDLLVGSAEPLRPPHMPIDAPGALRDMRHGNRDEMFDLARM